MKKNILASVCLSLLLVISAQAQSKAQRQDVESLRGLKGVRLVLMFGRAEAIEAGRRPEILKLLQSDAEARFAKAGIPLLKNAGELNNAPGSPQLVVTITMDKPNGYVFPVVTQSKLYQSAQLSRDPSVQLSLLTWETGGVGVYELTNLEMLRTQVGTEIDQFIKAYLAANPQPAE